MWDACARCVKWSCICAGKEMWKTTCEHVNRNLYCWRRLNGRVPTTKRSHVPRTRVPGPWSACVSGCVCVFVRVRARARVCASGCGCGCGCISGASVCVCARSVSVSVTVSLPTTISTTPATLCYSCLLTPTSRQPYSPVSPRLTSSREVCFGHLRHCSTRPTFTLSCPSTT